MKHIFLFILLAISIELFAQSQNNIGLPSVNNSFLTTGGGSSTGVDLYTGTAQISVPICNLGAKDFSIPIAINYMSGRGIKVQDYASNIGLGWQLNAGGGVSRVVRGFPDELPNGYLGTGQWGQQVANHMVNGAPLSSQVTGDNGSSYITPTADGEPDLFFIKTPFFTAQFVFDEGGQPVFSNNTGLKV
ncbi:MAG TPA: hypothetical protein VGN63_18955 [Flavisolibacter sp.]|jgi:hypothetical protein|nr:hypothetical protein [Flavisolibacter sp.]